MRTAICIGMGLVLLSEPALAQNTERPEVKVGDRWQFVRYYSAASTKPNLTWEINSVTATEISGTENGEPLLITPDLNVLDSPTGRSAFRWRSVSGGDTPRAGSSSRKAPAGTSTSMWR